MARVEFRGDRGDLERFARGALDGAVAVDDVSAFERRMTWDTAASSGFSSATHLRSGIALVATKLRWERPATLTVHQAPTALKFVLSRGAGPRVSVAGIGGETLGHGSLQITQLTRPIDATCEFIDSGELELVALEIQPARLRELLGTDRLPDPLDGVSARAGASLVMRAQPMAPRMFPLLDEILSCDGRRLSRQLHLEAKGLELLGAIVDELADTARSAPHGLCQQDIERLERARRLLLGRWPTPPSLPQLARLVGLNEVKLKRGFRAVFGTSVYGYLRSHRLKEAHRLLAHERCNVSEAAARVGYDNPSKFAAAFRKQFGMPPSAVRIAGDGRGRHRRS